MLCNSTMGLLEVDNLNVSGALSPNMELNSDTAEAETKSIECAHCLECLAYKIDFTSIILDKLEFLINSAPYHTLQWLASICFANRRIQQWLLDNMGLWVKSCLINHKQTNIRFSTAILLANLVPNRMFRETFTSNRNMLIPFKPPPPPNQQGGANLASNSTSNSSILSTLNQPAELNCEFDSVECKSVLHRIIKYLFSLMDELGQSAATPNKPNLEKING